MMWLSGGLAARGHEVTLFTEAIARELWPEYSPETFEVHLLPRSGLRRLLKSKRVAVFQQVWRLSKLLEPFDIIVPSVPPSHLWVTQAKKMNPRINGHVFWYFEGPLRRFYWKVTERHLLDHQKHCINPNYNLHLSRDIEYHVMRDQKRKREREYSWDREAAGRIDRIIAYSRFSAESFEQVFSTPVSVCYPGIPCGQGNHNDSRQPGEYVLAVAPLWAKKNVYNIIEALAILSARSSQSAIKLKIVGKGPCLSDLKALAETRKLAPRIEFIEYLSDEELTEAYRKARMTVYVPIDEPFGLIAVESMNQRVPPIVSNHGGLAEIVTHGETGLLVNPFDPAEVARAIELLWNEEDKNLQMGLAGKQRVERLFTLDRCLDRFEDLIATETRKG